MPEARRPLTKLVFSLFKRSLAAVCASVLLVVGVAPAASAAKRPHAPKVVQVIDWDAPKPAPGGATNRAIDWD
ncbi:hypothetical protein J2X11_001276 [Aeromicrobium panaciterrae]|uniref:Uncharacterized protein n=1 Tax=Aeromicrobium panaciterrae TaxID=363861 RepID=A0ABU1UMP6_9ACTN|nr:hypothetical protein [Aeromicrobium panaciterrae]MDR7086437.1 hypothetical protein [Aeromicrobium panaciterrae]